MNASQTTPWILIALSAAACFGCDAPATKTPATVSASSASDQAVSDPTTKNQTESTNNPSAIKVTPVDFAGFEAEIAKLKGKLVVVDVWSTGCPPCMKEYPKLVELSKKSGPTK